jgi:hypothetical protein
VTFYEQAGICVPGGVVGLLGVFTFEGLGYIGSGTGVSH